MPKVPLGGLLPTSSNPFLSFDVSMARASLMLALPVYLIYKAFSIICSL
jgi:hypothetical protein